jgi:hypothetical protein
MENDIRQSIVAAFCPKVEQEFPDTQVFGSVYWRRQHSIDAHCQDVEFNEAIRLSFQAYARFFGA